jgi:glycosyltransferase involved in cell wall biosynthesis
MASHVRGFTRGALALGHKISFIAASCVGIESNFDAKLIEPSTTVSATRTLYELWNNLLFTVGALDRVSSDIDAGEIDFIYQRYSRFNWTGVALSFATGLPLALEFNGSEVWIGRNWDPVGQFALLAAVERLNCRAADFIFVVSEVERRNLISAGVEPDKIMVNPNGVDTSEFQPGTGGDEQRRALGIQEKIVVGFAGTFGPWHGAPVMAEAALKTADARCHFLFIGDGDQRSLAESIVARERVGATFTGRVARDKVAAYLDACDILVSPHVMSLDGSEFFGSPTKLFEYMAMSKAIIASRLGQLADVIDDGENGILVEPGDPEGLALAIKRLADDEALRKRLGAAARQKVIRQYTWKHNAARVFERVKSE